MGKRGPKIRYFNEYHRILREKSRVSYEAKKNAKN